MISTLSNSELGNSIGCGAIPRPQGDRYVDIASIRAVSALFGDKHLLGLDIETGANGDAESLGLKPGTEALNPLVGRILLASLIGIKSGKSVSKWAYSDTNERKLLKGFFDTLNANRDALIVGHNFLSFDVPFILLRALKLGITPPLKFLKIAGLRTQTAMKEEGIYDSYFNFCNGNGSGLYTPCGPSLGDLDFFLGVKPPINGGAFGRAWEQPDPIVRQALISYNMQNIWEIYLLMAASGVGAQMGNRTAIPLYETSITSGVPWIGSDVEPLPEGAIWVKKPDRPNTNRVYCGVWTAPKADFMATGPSDSKGWGRVISEETKASSPFTTQRLHPFGMQVVGGFIQDENGFHYVLNSKDESRAILETVALFKTVSDRPCFAHSAGSTRAILAVRSMKYGFSMPAWFAPYFKGKEWLKSLSFPDELSVASFSKSRGWLESGMEEAGHPPLWLDNADSCRFLDRAESQARAALQYISSLRLSHDADFETEPAFISKAA